MTMRSLNFFRKLLRKQPPSGESAPQLSRFDLRSFERPPLPTGLPPATLQAMEGDAMVQTALTIKSLAVLATPGEIVPGEDSPFGNRVARWIENQFATMAGSADDILRQGMSAFGRGWSVQEMVLDRAGGEVRLVACKPKDPSLFGLRVDRYGNVSGLVLEVPGEPAVDLPRQKFVVHVHRRSFGFPRGRSDLEAAYPHWSAKQALLKSWRLHLERYASPTVLGRYDRGTPFEEQASALDALSRLNEHTALLVPNQIEVAMLGADRSFSTGFAEAIEFHNREIARAVLGQTLTTDEGRRVGSMALGRVHLQVLLLQIEAIRRELSDTLMTEQVIRPLVEWNFGSAPVPRYRFKPVRLEAFAEGRIV
ncbi:MAG: hypothetical protein HONBIEJF_02075 [Fimbriimonadaceae bacterium]|nr:hypothetical protein [Fimbriimonadaceae bacterium]